MFKVYLPKIWQFIIRVWHFIRESTRKKGSSVVMIINGKKVYESDPRGQRILRRLRQNKKSRAGGNKTKIS